MDWASGSEWIVAQAAGVLGRAVGVIGIWSGTASVESLCASVVGSIASWTRSGCGRAAALAGSDRDGACGKISAGEYGAAGDTSGCDRTNSRSCQDSLALGGGCVHVVCSRCVC